MAISPINFFTPSNQANAVAAVEGFASPTSLTNLTGVSQATLTSFSAVLGQVLADLGPLAFNNTLTNIGTGNNAGGGGGLTSTLFTLLLLNSLDQGQLASQPVAQQLLVTQLLVNSTGTSDALGLGTIANAQLAAALTQPGVGSTLLTQLTNVSIHPNPILFSAGALAQAFQIGNGIGEPA